MTPKLDAALIGVGGPTNARPLGAAPTHVAARTAAEVDADLERAQAAGARLVVLAGGEVCCRRDLAALLGLAARRRLATGIVTNGRMLAYPARRAALVAARVEYVRVALHGPTAAVHDALVGVDGAFDQTLGAIDGLLAEAPATTRVDVACTVVTDNVAHLSAMCDLLVGRRRTASLSLRFVAPLDGLAANEWPQAQAATVAITAALERASTLDARVVLAFEGFPPCLFAEHAHLRDEVLRFGAPAFGPDDAIDALARERTGSRSKPYPCQDCRHEATCPGAPTWSIERWGERVLRPTRVLRANSFNFEHVRELGAAQPRPAECPVRRLADDADPVEALVLAGRDDGLELYRTDTSDFARAEVRRVKEDLQQIYLDVSETAALTDFTNGVRRVRLHEACRACGERAACPTTWVVDPAVPFDREERWLRKEVSRLRGRVLDVGCGEQPYREEIAEGIASGRIEYHGLDPDAGAIERFRAAGVGGTLTVGTIEEYEAPARYFDYVIGFRSLNHFRDVERALKVIERLLRPEGMLYLCDSLAFGMLRTRAQVRYADERAAVGHEHYRNWSSDQVLALALRFAFRIDVHRPVSAHTSNQWLLKLMRTPETAASDTTGGP